MDFLGTLGEWREDKKKEEATHDEEVLYLLRACKAFGDGMPPQPTQTNHLRSSQMHGVCPREFVMNYWQPRPNRSFDMKSQFMMGMGTHIHDYVQNAILGPMGVLHGKWVTNYGSGAAGEPEDKIIRKKMFSGEDGPITHFVRTGFHPDPEKTIWELSQQKPLTWRYEEEKVWSEKYRISGHVDGVVSLDRIMFLYENRSKIKKDYKSVMRDVLSISAEDLALFELKVSGTFVWDKVLGGSSIAPYYKTQANIYQKLRGLHKTVFWYINRNDIKSKAFIYNHNNSIWVEAKRKALVVWKSIRDETLPDSMKTCKIPTEKRARDCVFGKECWSHRFDFKAYVEEGKKMAAEEGRKLLNLSDWRGDGE